MSFNTLHVMARMQIQIWTNRQTDQSAERERDKKKFGLNCYEKTKRMRD